MVKLGLGSGPGLHQDGARTNRLSTLQLAAFSVQFPLYGERTRPPEVALLLRDQQKGWAVGGKGGREDGRRLPLFLPGGAAPAYSHAGEIEWVEGGGWNELEIGR